MRRLLSVLGSALVLLPAAVAFAQKAPPGTVGSSAPEAGLLLMAGAVALPLLLGARCRKP